ncbi:hypothetical protein MCM47_15460 [Kitasatospora sp. A2-31]|nr:hypothetical protein [Kitasatospora sp. A2-31]
MVCLVREVGGRETMSHPAQVYVVVDSSRNAGKVGLSGTASNVRVHQHAGYGWELYRSLVLPTREQASQVEDLVKGALQLRGVLGFLRPEEMPQGGYTETFDIRVVSPAEVFGMVVAGAALLPPIVPGAELAAVPVLVELDAASKKSRFGRLKDKFFRKAARSAPAPEPEVVAPPTTRPAIPLPSARKPSPITTETISNPNLQTADLNRRLAARLYTRPDPYEVDWTLCATCKRLTRALVAVILWDRPECFRCRPPGFPLLVPGVGQHPGVMISGRTRRVRPGREHRSVLTLWGVTNGAGQDVRELIHSRSVGWLQATRAELLARAIIHRLDFDYGMTPKQPEPDTIYSDERDPEKHGGRLPYRFRSRDVDARHLAELARTEYELLNAADARLHRALTETEERALQEAAPYRWSSLEETLPELGRRFFPEFPGFNEYPGMGIKWPVEAEQAASDTGR